MLVTHFPGLKTVGLSFLSIRPSIWGSQNPWGGAVSTKWLSHGTPVRDQPI